MTKGCTTCFYGAMTTTADPCKSCTGFSNFVDVRSFADKPSVKKIGVKYDSDKPQWSLVPWTALSQVVDVLTYGAKKYAPDNWKKVPNARQRYVDAGFRHFTAYVGGEKNDSETGMSHLAHAMCCLLFLLAFDLGEDDDTSNS